jgi:hypothetical protein
LTHAPATIPFGHGPEYLVKDAVLRLPKEVEQFRAAVREGIAAADRGEFVEDDEGWANVEKKFCAPDAHSMNGAAAQDLTSLYTASSNRPSRFCASGTAPRAGAGLHSMSLITLAARWPVVECVDWPAHFTRITLPSGYCTFKDCIPNCNACISCIPVRSRT